MSTKSDNVRVDRINASPVVAALCTAIGVLGIAVGAAAQDARPMPPPSTQAPRAVSPAELGKHWLVTNQSVDANVPISGRNLDKPTCAALTYVIQSDGTTTDIRLDRLVPDGDLGTVAISVVRGLRYVPGASNSARDPVRTRVVLPMNMPDVQVGNQAQRAAAVEFRDKAMAACDAPAVAPAPVPAK